MKKTIEYLNAQKRSHIPITMLTAYDYPTAKIEDDAGIDCVLVGDSVGTNVLGYASERDVTLDDMRHHLRAVAKGVTQAFLLVDMPYQSADTPEDAFKNAEQFMTLGADCVKIEGWSEKQEVVAHLAAHGVPVCAHIGYNPQIHGAKPHTFGKDAAQAIELIESATILQNAGAIMIVLEKVPEEVVAIIADRLAIPTIGIGCGARSDGQVLVIHDIIGMSSYAFKHARRYAELGTLETDAVKAYITDVTSKKFPSEGNTIHIAPEELAQVRDSLMQS